MDEIKQIKAQCADRLMVLRNVVSLGVGYKRIAGVRTDEPCIVVGVKQKVPCHLLPPTQQVPRTIGGVRTDVVQVGEIKALQTRKDKWRPAPGGVSIGHVNVSAGTLGCVVFKDGEPVILSNNHVLADSNRGKVGDPVVQPGTYDGGTLDDQIAVLEEWVPISFDFEAPDCPTAQKVAHLCDRLSLPFGSRFRAEKQAAANLVDAAIARPLLPDMVEAAVLGIGEPAGVVEGELGMAVCKSGRTTELSGGQITQVDVTVRVLYGTAIATFEDQLAGNLASDGGDSGSIVFDMDGYAVGLLFAGGEGVTIFNRARNVADALGISFV